MNKDEYIKKIRELTLEQLNENSDKIPGFKNYKKKGYEVDHIVSIEDGWNNNGSDTTAVAVNRIASWVNLRIVGPGINESKGADSFVTIKQLNEAIENQEHVLG